jgi:hypothetical protein
MLDFKTQSQFVDASAAMMRSYLVATTSTWAASACRGLSLWVELTGGARRLPQPPLGPALWPSVTNWMQAPHLYPAAMWPWQQRESAARATWPPFAHTWLGPSFSLWAPLADWAPWGRATMPAWSWWFDAAALGGQVHPAAAQPLEGSAGTGTAGYSSYRSTGGHAAAQVVVPVAALTATVLSPMHAMWDAWRAAFRA